MRSSNSNDDFINYAYGNWLTKKWTREFLRLLKEFCSASIASNKDFRLQGIVKFQIETTSTTFAPWEKFKKVKAYPAINIIKLSKKKWRR